MKKLAIIGAGGHGKVVADTATQLGWSDICFFDDVWPERKHNGVWPITNAVNSLLSQLKSFDGIIVAIGHNKTRLDICLQILEGDGHLVTLIHPTAYVSQYTHLGEGSVVFANAVINPDSSIGLAGIVNTGATIDHDCKIGHGVHISPGAHIAGEVTIGDRSWVGIGAVIKQQILIGSDVIIGAGAAVVNNIANHLTVVGVPAKNLRDAVYDN